MNERSESAEKSELDRREMIANQIEARGIRDPRVLAAIRAVPREQFVPPNQQVLAYDDRALSIEQEQTPFKSRLAEIATGLNPAIVFDEVIDMKFERPPPDYVANGPVRFADPVLPQN